jgi:hypothetical protein
MRNSGKCLIEIEKHFKMNKQPITDTEDTRGKREFEDDEDLINMYMKE